MKSHDYSRLFSLEKRRLNKGPFGLSCAFANIKLLGWRGIRTRVHAEELTGYVEQLAITSRPSRLQFSKCIEVMAGIGEAKEQHKFSG